VLCLEGDLVKVFRPVTEPAGLVKFGGLNFGDSTLRVPKELVQSDRAGLNHSVGNKGLNA